MTDEDRLQNPDTCPHENLSTRTTEIRNWSQSLIRAEVVVGCDDCSRILQTTYHGAQP